MPLARAILVDYGAPPYALIAAWWFTGLEGLTDEYGRVTVKLDETLNEPGALVVDGDLHPEGPVVDLAFTLSSDRSGSTDGQIDFGTFQLGMPGGTGAEVRGSVLLSEADARTLVAAIQAQLSYRASHSHPTPEQPNEKARA